MRSYLTIAILLAGAALVRGEEPREIERRIIQYIEENLEPGKPLIVSRLYNEVFTDPAERKVLDKLNRAFFRIPLYIVEHQMAEDRLPTLEEIAGQFDFYGPEEADVVLSIMESDPRVPDFLTRDPETGELQAIDVEKVKADKRFNQVVERSITGWEGKPAPALAGTSFEGEEIRLSDLAAGKPALVYVWFTNCPPCVKSAPEIAALHEKYEDQGFTVLGANADRVLGLPYDDAVRSEYVEKHSIEFPNIHLTEETRAALGDVNIFPTLFLVDGSGTIVKYYVNYQPPERLEKDIEEVLSPATSSGSVVQ